MNIKQTVVILLSCLFVVSCTYNKDELPKPDGGESSGGGGNPITITYTSHAKAIIDAKCVTCHSPTPIDFQKSPFLTTYTEVFAKKSRIQARSLDSSGMPTAGSSTGALTPTEKDTLQMWLDQGALQ